MKQECDSQQHIEFRSYYFLRLFTDLFVNECQKKLTSEFYVYNSLVSTMPFAIIEYISSARFTTTVTYYTIFNIEYTEYYPTALTKAFTEPVEAEAK